LSRSGSKRGRRHGRELRLAHCAPDQPRGGVRDRDRPRQPCRQFADARCCLLSIALANLLRQVRQRRTLADRPSRDGDG